MSISLLYFGKEAFMNDLIYLIPKSKHNKEDLLTAINNYLDRNKSTETQRYVHGDKVCDTIDRLSGF